jgi:hypothetical protein
VIHSSVLSDIENDKESKTVTLEQVAAVAAVDPQHRGKLWLAWGEAEDATLRPPHEAVVGSVPLRAYTSEEDAQAIRDAEELARVRKTAKSGRKRPGARRPK